MRSSSKFRTATALAAVSVAAAFALTACSSNSSKDEGITVVASTNVWGDVAQAVAGDKLTVTSIINEPSADPHSFEATPADAAKITDASLVVYNGGGYDQFITDVLDAGKGEQKTVNAYNLLDGGIHAGETAGESHDGHTHGAVNEHVWFDIPTVDAVAHSVADQLSALDPDNAATYEDNAKAYSQKLAGVTAITDSIAAAHAGAPVAQTEPIAHYLLVAAELKDATPEEFTSAIEDGNDPSPAAIAATRQLLSEKQARALVYNIQTQDKVTQDMRTTAETAGVPVVEVTETLPEGLDYIQWQTQTAESLANALSAQ
ncbi:metal ABC transporter solute-binding protein, Zn/Mn family [Rhodococcus erythropolis]|uniref:metal ABC transporter solute-binding protein, Zn/Mn family n=1 Tax=Rhodococcus TaxID=1827 RepID=UPI000BB2E538|nr:MULTISPECIES: zinc ABC transporter substrate-binding protein [Rhodococcus]NHP15227.1 zinc ABC transporter solute-binding protein [Rhodococcus sp. IC4_135]MBT2263577.1 zinc ABC transporter substrate-binding protein [Rhodococcus erythropolis]PBI97297.1 Manganese ABC transporter substrate-binding lipoprotein precursor [Rhodococcus erythropolis]RQO44693.1 ABC transporter permease [Rhodococcus sp. KBW08]UJC76860.1 ABC transporter permease [Rhodococcus erythropolis]